MMFNKILGIFPPPDLLNIPYTGLSISDTALRCIQFGKRNGSLYVKKYAERLLTPGAVVAGSIVNTAEIGLILTEFKKDLHLDHVKVSLPEEKAYLFTSKIAKVPQKEVRNTIEFKMEENVPVSPSELVFDYALVEVASDYIRVVVSALPTSVVDAYVDVVHGAGLSVLGLEIESQAITRALLPAGAHGTFLIVHFGQDKFGLYVVCNGLVHFTSTISTKALGPDISVFLTSEIKKLYTYWDTLKENIGKEERKIQHIIMCGENFGEEIISSISAHTQTPVTVGNVWTNVASLNTYIPPIPFEYSLRYAPAVGLALPSDTVL